MNALLRRIRGALGMGVTWAIGWIPVGVIYTLTILALTDTPVALGTALWISTKLFAGLGLVAGTLFSGILGIAEGRHRFDELKGGRIASWGAVGGLLLGGLASFNGVGGPGFGGEDLFVMALTALLGTTSAVATLAIARSSGPDALPSGDTELDDAGLTDGEKRELLNA